MVRNSQILRAFEQDLIRREPLDYRKNLEIANALYEEACNAGVFPLEDPLDGIEIDIRLRQIINSVRKTS